MTESKTGGDQARDKDGNVNGRRFKTEIKGLPGKRHGGSRQRSRMRQQKAKEEEEGCKKENDMNERVPEIWMKKGWGKATELWRWPAALTGSPT